MFEILSFSNLVASRVRGASPDGAAVAVLVGVSVGAAGALAAVGADQVVADGPVAARVPGALVDVDAGPEGTN